MSGRTVGVSESLVDARTQRLVDVPGWHDFGDAVITQADMPPHVFWTFTRFNDTMVMPAQ